MHIGLNYLLFIIYDELYFLYICTSENQSIIKLQIQVIMKTKNLYGILLLFFCTVGFISCDNEDDNSRGFMQEATIIGDSINGYYYCYWDGGGFAISHDQELAGIERGYFSFSYLEDDWKTTANNIMYIDNAHVLPYSIYNVIRPISIEEAKNQHITDKDSCLIPASFSLSHGYRGYFDLNTGLSIVNTINVEKVPVKLNMVYDPAKQTPDTLRLQFCYNPRIPDGWSKTSLDYGAVSCDITSFATLEQWSDSVTIVVEVGDQKKHLTKISKKDFFKPDVKIE